MFERRETLPLLTKKTSGGNGFYSLGRITTCHALLAGILFGMALGMFLSVTMFSWMPYSRESESETHKPMADMLPSIKEENSKPQYFEQYNASLLEDAAEKKEDVEVVVEVKEKEADVEEEISRLEDANLAHLLHEGTREISEEEKKGGWRFLPEILKVSEHFPRVQVMSEREPRVLLFKQFLSEEEVAHIVELASSHLTRSKVVGGKDGSENDIRTSYGAWLTNKLHDSVVQKVEKRIHNAVGIPLEFGEGIYVLRYEKTQKYNPHTDNCARAGEKVRDACLDFLRRSGGPECGEGHGGVSCGDRIATFILYLKTPILGGETIFPKAKFTRDNLEKAGIPLGGDFSQFCQSSLYFKVQPNPGDAVLFWDYVPRDDIDNHATFERSGSWEHQNATTEAFNDNSSLHGGCPVIDGEKWIATKWIRSTKFS